MTSADFAAAQQRVLERRRLRETEAQDVIEQRRNDRASAIEKLPTPVNRAVNASLSLWDTVKGREGTQPAFRVGQVDAELLDEELLVLFKGQVGEALKYYGVRTHPIFNKGWAFLGVDSCF